MFRARFALVGLILVAWACGGEDEGAGGGGEGAACVDGSNCSHGLFCFLPNPEPSGTCTKLPAACGGKGSCDCLKDFDASCSESTSCLGIVGEYALACGQSGSFRQEGESCSQLIHCDSGLSCVVPRSGVAGTCTKNS